MQPSSHWILEHFHHLKKSPLSYYPSTTSFPTSPATNLLSITKDFPILDFHMNGIVWFVGFLWWLISLTIMFSLVHISCSRYLNSFLFDIFFRAVLGSEQNWEEAIEISHIPPRHTPLMHSLPHYWHPPPDGTFVMADEPTLIHHYHQSPQFTLGLTLGVFMSAWYFIICVHHIYWSVHQLNIWVVGLFLRNCWTVPQSGRTMLYSHQQYMRAPVAPCPCQHLLFSAIPAVEKQFIARIAN